jgi:hypothetical protein
MPPDATVVLEEFREAGVLGLHRIAQTIEMRWKGIGDPYLLHQAQCLQEGPDAVVSIEVQEPHSLIEQMGLLGDAPSGLSRELNFQPPPVPTAQVDVQTVVAVARLPVILDSVDPVAKPGHLVEHRANVRRVVVASGDP